MLFSVNRTFILRELHQFGVQLKGDPDRIAKKLRENQNTLSGMSTVPSVFLQKACMFIVGLEHSRCDLIFKKSRLHHSFIFGMLYWVFKKMYTIFNLNFD